MELLKDKLALVTGAGGGLGGAIAAGFAREGARVIVADIQLESATRTADAITAAGGEAWPLAIDVTERAAVRAFAAQVGERFGAIDILVNNAGISARSRIDDEQAPEVWDRLIDVNLQGLFNVTHAFVPQLKETRGCIVNLSSIVAFVSGISSAGYIASKGAVRSLTQALARDLAPFGVRTNAVAPGLMLTEMVAPQLAVPGGTDWYMHRVPMARGGEVEEIVGPVVFLCSPMASYVNGVVLPVDGGFLSA
ncbi:NAD(P)-dependent dehydrogenase, short-chain alcohol dehydrogenase family [Variovorax sp. HW608]|uniref:SDR family NAD(P)-dependent oxidoreductase n=1 Tax=Variovorax sp. HW608 TaxID=1034889 RepID=UPI00081FEFA2|nr:SDR family NAD(P)-dependent oxidoreductase [Variovorax sp. HW608]SCK43604.1 NAD(P)-dependent dehydrogenase, short-chain alcohol dehydrogenase family [Variovorax sp. HW608]